jgi:hypothetical protein
LPISLVNSVADEHAAVAAGRALPGPPGIVAASDSAGAKDCADLDEVGSRS